MTFGEPTGQGWVQVGELGLAFALSALIGLEREIRQKSAGLRTYTLVGFASALIMLVSKYGFTDILTPDRVVLDPSRIAAQIVSGIGFIGGGLIFVRRDVVRGLTTAATVWITASIGMACGAGLPILALLVTAGHFVVIFTFPHIVRSLSTSRWAPTNIIVSYEDGKGILRDVIAACTQFDFVINRLQVERQHTFDGPSELDIDDEYLVSEIGELRGNAPTKVLTKIVSISIELAGRDSIHELTAKLQEIDGVESVKTGTESGPAD
jgi:putative Mg2+ transporter-C (MgtC) family protein